MRIFITNDDGIHSPGIERLAAHLDGIGSGLLVGAPDQEMSAAGTSLRHPGSSREIHIRPHSFQDAPQVEAHAVVATPAMTAILARRGLFGDPPDIVVSGPNRGVNMGTDVHHSGTVGAALTAVKHGGHGLAVSIESNFEEDERLHWDTAAVVAATLVRALVRALLAAPVLLNVNVPNRTIDDLEGIRTTRLAGVSPVAFDRWDERPHEEGGRVVTLPWGELRRHEGEAGTDIRAVREGYVSVTWLTIMGHTDPDPAHELDDLAGLVWDALSHG